MINRNIQSHQFPALVLNPNPGLTVLHLSNLHRHFSPLLQMTAPRHNSTNCNTILHPPGSNGIEHRDDLSIKLRNGITTVTLGIRDNGIIARSKLQRNLEDATTTSIYKGHLLCCRNPFSGNELQVSHITHIGELASRFINAINREPQILTRYIHILVCRDINTLLCYGNSS